MAGLEYERRTVLGLALGLSLARPAAADLGGAEAARIAAIETDLRPRIVVRGDPIAPASMAERMAFYAVPGVSLAFFDADRIRWTRQYGLADAVTRRPVTDRTLFQASSISKLVTALATLRLVRDGRLSLDEDVNARLVGWKVPENDYTRVEKVTVRRLLSHTAGVTVGGFSGYAPGAPLPTTRQILEGAPPANSPPITIDVTPGSTYRYSGGGYVILQQLFEDVTGEPFASTLAHQVLAPAGMTRSTYAQPLTNRLRPFAASGHAADGTPMPGGGAVFPEVAPAGLWSTPSDLARLAIEFGRELDGRSDRILDSTMARRMLERQSGDWGLGVDIGKAGQEPRFSHVGNNPGFQSFLVYFPQRRQGVAIMTNGANQSGFFYEIAMAVARACRWPGFEPLVRDVVVVDASILARYAGTWKAEGAPPFAVTIDGGRLFVQGGPFGPRLVALLAQSETRFFILSTGFSFDFTGAARNEAVLGGGLKALRQSVP
ncbi:MAG TPA: serine hydrolase [Caulobacter sp.]|nr:serine hydrolase [Caulobacter sp.]